MSRSTDEVFAAPNVPVSFRSLRAGFEAVCSEERGLQTAPPLAEAVWASTKSGATRLQKGPFMRFSLILGSMLAFGLVGCGEDEEENPPPASDPAEVNPAIAQAATQSVTGAIQLAQGGDGMAAAFALTAVGTSAFSIVTPTGQSAPQSVAIDGSAQQALSTGVCECTETSCTFDGCGDDGSPFTISGTISWTATSLQCDLSFSGNSAGSDYAFDQECDLTFSETLLDGTFRSIGSLDIAASGQSVSTDWESNLEYKSVTLSNGCPTGGSVDVSATVTANGQTYGGSGSVSFDGTGC